MDQAPRRAQAVESPPLSWRPSSEAPAFLPREIEGAVLRVREGCALVREGRTGRLGVGFGGEFELGAPSVAPGVFPAIAALPPLYPEWLGDRTFLEVQRVRFPYVAGAMANGIATTALVIALGRAGMLGFFGAAGLAPSRVEAALVEIEDALSDGWAWGVNLIHSPNEPELENTLAELYLRRSVTRVCASAYMALTPAVVRYALHGISRDETGRVARKNRLFAKVSRPEVARRFLSPAPAEIVQALSQKGLLTPSEAELSREIPLAEDVTVEADSGGHTDNRPLTALFPSIRALADELAVRHSYARPIRVGAAGGLGTPSAVAAAFTLGAAYVMTGTINQASREAGLSEDGKRMLAEADLADVMMAPAADMFELGVKVQVLRRGTLFGVRAARLFEVYNTYDSIESIPEGVRAKLSREIFGMPLEAVWDETRRFFEERDPRESSRALREPKHRLALVCRWYLGKSSRWAIDGVRERRMDYQIWCGPAMGAFNSWVAGSFLSDLKERSSVEIALNLLEGAAVVTRAQELRSHGVAVPATAFQFKPRRLT